MRADIQKVAFDAAYYFHGTRTIDPRLFLADGIKPLGLVIDHLWDALHLLCADDIPADRWQAIRRELEHDRPRSRSDDHSAWLYRLKQPDPAHHGPYASLIREHAVNPIGGQHDYLATPEIIQDITGHVGGDLQAKFEAAATSCVAKFRHPEVGLHQVEVADGIGEKRPAVAMQCRGGFRYGVADVDGHLVTGTGERVRVGHRRDPQPVEAAAVAGGPHEVKVAVVHERHAVDAEEATAGILQGGPEVVRALPAETCQQQDTSCAALHGASPTSSTAPWSATRRPLCCRRLDKERCRS